MLPASTEARARMSPILHRRRDELLLLILAALVAAAELLHRWEPRPPAHAAWLIGDCGSYRDVTRALLAHGTVRYDVVNPEHAAFYAPGHGQDGMGPGHVALAADGTLVPVRPLLFPLALLVPYAAAAEHGLLAFNVAQCALLLLLVYWLCRRYHDARAALLAAAAFLATSALRPFFFNVSPDVFGSVLLLAGLLLVWRERPAALLAGGLLLGLSCWLRPLNLAAVLALLPAAITAARARRLDGRVLWPVSGLLLGGSGQLVLNALWFGSPLVTSYDRWLLMRRGSRVVVSLRARWTRPFWSSLLPTLLLHRVSFLQTAPYWPLLLPAAVRLGRRSATEAAALLVLALAPVLWLAKYEYWDATHFGNRFMLPSAALAALGLAWLVERVLSKENPSG
jgi:hypothetical protein